MTGIEVIHLRDTNGLQFDAGVIRKISDTKSLLIQGSNATATASDKAQWCSIGQSPWDGDVYDIYEYHTGAAGDCTAATASAIQVGLEHGGVTWAN